MFLSLLCRKWRASHPCVRRDVHPAWAAVGRISRPVVAKCWTNTWFVRRLTNTPTNLDVGAYVGHSISIPHPVVRTLCFQSTSPIFMEHLTTSVIQVHPLYLTKFTKFNFRHARRGSSGIYKGQHSSTRPRPSTIRAILRRFLQVFDFESLDSQFSPQL